MSTRAPKIEHSQEVDRLLREKFTNEELYAWMQGEMSRLHYEYYRFAFDTARKAEQAMKQELLRPELDETDFVRFNYRDAGRKGLLSGEALYLDVKRLDLAYHEHNKREYKLTRHVSLRQPAPEAPLRLKATGECEMSIPEWLFALDAPNLYMRRIKTVSQRHERSPRPRNGAHRDYWLARGRVRPGPAAASGKKCQVSDRVVSPQEPQPLSQPLDPGGSQEGLTLFQRFRCGIQATHSLPRASPCRTAGAAADRRP